MHLFETSQTDAPECVCPADIKDVLGLALERDQGVACPVHSATNSLKAVPLGDHLARRIATALGATVDGDLPPAA